MKILNTLIFSVLLLTTASAYADTVITLNRDRTPAVCSVNNDPVQQSYILVETNNEAEAVLVLFAGGSGKLNLADQTLGINSNNFLVRSRHFFAGHKFHIAVLDAATDFLSCPEGLRGHRLSFEHGSDIAAVIEDLRIRYPNKAIWAVGTSRGSTSAAQAAAVLAAGSSGPDGIVLSSSVTRPSATGNTVLDVALEIISVPTLIVAHREDSCVVTPPGDSKSIKTRLTSTPKSAIRIISGGLPALSEACGALSPHGYFGVELRVIKKISHWIKKRL